MKTCKKCKEIKPLSAFAADKSKPDGLLYICRACVKIRDKKAYKKRVKKEKILQREAKKRIKMLQKSGSNTLQPSPDIQHTLGVGPGPSIDETASQEDMNIFLKTGGVKQCKLCRDEDLINEGWKHTNEFKKDPTQPDGLEPYCIECNVKRDIEDILKTMKKNGDKERLKIMKAKLKAAKNKDEDPYTF